MFLVSLFAMLLANEDEFARQWLCDVSPICLHSSHSLGWNKIVYDLALASATSILFYWLLVRWPENSRRTRLKTSFVIQYRAFRLSCIDTFLCVSDGSYDSELPGRLLNLSEFRAYFHEDVGNKDNRWYQVQNNLNDHHQRKLIALLEQFREEIAFVLYNVDIDDENVLEFFKRFSRIVYSYKQVSAEYDDVKSMCGLMWSLFTGWSVIEGYTDRDIVADMIDAI